MSVSYFTSVRKIPCLRADGQLLAERVHLELEYLMNIANAWQGWEYSSRETWIPNEEVRNFETTGI
ncbi:hypothetical protein [Desulfosporosinus hippei]|uniref:Uncharacterized protein n=1 Tax=Desulfosporosinus hippei DSM 8344 TaxID=1121419 RepID=A0A1G7SE28_9FIRM|nr:hypothetical protein [Desulfosporosinus hippei]SDG21142.1 hypothetical protein SAMN05443529_101364 [Desulfosporosinus hippei DSM 8344]